MVKRSTAVASTLCSFLLATSTYAAETETVASRYYPPWTNELAWVNSPDFSRPYGSAAWLEENYVPWWQTRVAHPVKDYTGDALNTGHARLDVALEAGLTFHRPKKSWDVETSPSGINNVWAFTPGSTQQEPQTARGYQNAYLNFGMHPIEPLSFDIGAELLGNDDQRYWFPVSDEHRMHKDDVVGRVVRAEAKYDTEAFMIRGFAGEPVWGWVGQNDLFQLLPTQSDVEFARRYSGDLIATGGESRITTEDFGTLTVLGGSQIRWGYGPSAFAKYDLPTFGKWENSFVYRNEEIPWDLKVDHERRWAASYNSSYLLSERTSLHGGLMYQPFRLGEAYQDNEEVNGTTFTSDHKTTQESDAIGATVRGEFLPDSIVDRAALGYTYLGPTAGNKHQIDADAGKTLFTDWTLSGAYIYRHPVVGAEPLFYEGTPDNPGAILSSPRGPDDPFHVWWNNREAHVGSFTLLFDPTPATAFFKHQRNILEEWNVDPEEDASWSGAVQYRTTYYPTNTDRLYTYDEDRNIIWDPTFHTGALATKYPFSSGLAMVRWKHNRWVTLLELAGGQALAGSALAYTPQTDFYKPSTIFFSGGVTVEYKPVKGFFRYGKDVWGPADYHTSYGWSYHEIYQAGISTQFWRDFEVGFRYVGTRMTEEFIGSDMGAFNEYRGYLTYHFTLEKDFSKPLANVGRPLPKAIPEGSLAANSPRFYPAGGGEPKTLQLKPRAVAEAGVLSWKITVRGPGGDAVRQWEGRGTPPESLQWEGVAPDGKPLQEGRYQGVLEFADLYGNEVVSTPLTITLIAAQKPEYTLVETTEGLRLTLSSLVLFDVDKYDLKPMAKQALDQVGELLKAYPKNNFRVSGHTDSQGPDTYNKTLSEKRAAAVAGYLTTQFDILKSRLTVMGYGESKPIADNATAEGRQQNRRVEIDILK